MATATPVTRRRQRKSITLSQPKTPKDVRQLDRSEMIEYLQKYDENIPSDIDNMMRAALQKRVIHCMKQRRHYNNQNNNKHKLAQSAIPNARNIRKRKAEIPMTSTRYKKAKMNNGHPSRLPITNLLSETNDEYKSESAELCDLSALELNFDTLNDTNTEFEMDDIDESKANEPSENNNNNNINALKDKLLKAVRKGIPARYDILALPHSIRNIDENTSYFRSTKAQKLFENVHMGHELMCIVRTDDDVYRLKHDAIEQIESAVTKWVHKYGEYSDILHPSIIQNDQNQFQAQSHIFQYEVLGRFIGDEMIENEFAEV